MNINIKQSILDTARELFSEKGFHDTSMRDIAAALKISVGNLTYHYKKKEDLIEEIAIQDHQKYQKPKPFHTLRDLNQLFQRITEQKNSRPYYYRYYVELSQICPAIYEMQVSVLRDLNDVLTESFQNFADQSLLKKEFSQEYSNIIITIMTLMVYGLPDFYKLQQEECNSRTLNCIWSVMIPCLSEQGYKEYLHITQEESACI